MQSGRCMSKRKKYSLAICYPVWNRLDLFQVSLKSLLRQLDGITAGIWIFDNGSDAATRQFIERLSNAEHDLFKVFLPRNMGLPFVVNIFSQLLTQDCDYAGYQAPAYVMLADADAYFKKPVRDMIEILESRDLSVLSGHDSIEHESVGEFFHVLRGETIRGKIKTIERGLCLLMRKAVLARCVPFPHQVKSDVDWELMQRHPNSVLARGGRAAAVDYVAHIGLYDSTWHPVGVPSNRAEIAEINRILEREGLLSPERKARMEKYYRSLKPDPALAS